MQRRTPRLKTRRGATAVLVAILIVVVGGMAAFAIDLARVYTGVNEMQTGADASALAGAIQLQHSGASPVSAVQSFAANNLAFGSAISVPSADVQGGLWNPAASTFTASANWAVNNAVRVTTRATPATSFGRLMGRTSVSATRSAVAWIANQSTRDCIKPWGIDVATVNALLTNPITTQAGIAELRSRTSTLPGQQALTIIVGPDGNTAGNALPARFQALTGANSSRRQYQNAIIDQACDNTSDYSAGTVTQVQPGNGGGDVPRTTVSAVELNLQGNQGNGGVQTCRAQTDLNDATCYIPGNGAAVAGPTVVVAVVSPTPGNTSSATLVSFVQFRLMCMFRGGGVQGNGNQPGTARATEVCPWLSAYRAPAGNFIQGTLVGYPLPSVAVNGAGNTLGNTLSSAQKLVLVR